MAQDALNHLAVVDQDHLCASLCDISGTFGVQHVLWQPHLLIPLESPVGGAPALSQEALSRALSILPNVLDKADDKARDKGQPVGRPPDSVLHNWGFFSRIHSQGLPPIPQARPRLARLSATCSPNTYLGAYPHPSRFTPHRIHQPRPFRLHRVRARILLHTARSLMSLATRLRPKPYRDNLEWEYAQGQRAGS